MADKFWVGGGSTTDWAATANTNWALTSGGANNAAVPTSSDRVIFDAASGSGPCSIAASKTVQAVNCAGLSSNPFTGTLSITSVGTLNMSNATGVASIFVAGMTLTVAAGGIVIHSPSAGTANFTTGGRDFVSLFFQGAGTTSLQDDVTISGALSHTVGTVVTNNHTITAVSFTGTGSSTRTLTLGSSAINLSKVGGTAWTHATSTGLTMTANTAVVTCSGASTTFNSSIDMNGMSLVFTGTGSGVVVGPTKLAAVTATGCNLTVSGVCTFGAITTGGGFTLTLPISTVTTLPTAAGWHVNGVAGNLATVRSGTGGTAATITTTDGLALASNFLSLRDVTATNLGTAARSTSVSGNTGWTFPMFAGWGIVQ